MIPPIVGSLFSWKSLLTKRSTREDCKFQPDIPINEFGKVPFLLPLLRVARVCSDLSEEGAPVAEVVASTWWSACLMRMLRVNGRCWVNEYRAVRQFVPPKPYFSRIPTDLSDRAVQRIAPHAWIFMDTGRLALNRFTFVKDTLSHHSIHRKAELVSESVDVYIWSQQTYI